MRIYVNPDIANAAPMLQTTDIHGLHFELGLKGLVTLVKEFPRSRIMPIKILRQLYDGRLDLKEAKDIIDFTHSIMEAAKLI